MSDEIKQDEKTSCKVTYFIGKMLAKGGTLSFTDDGLLFTPTALDKMMGAIEIPISFSDMVSFHYDDSLQKKLEIITSSRKHRFIGSGLGEIHSKLIVLKKGIVHNQAQNLNQLKTPASTSLEIQDRSLNSSEICFNCSRPVKSSFKYCPFCRTQLKLICKSCKEVVEENWISCPNCNSELNKS